VLDDGWKMFGAGCPMFDAGWQMFDVGCPMFDARCWIADVLQAYLKYLLIDILVFPAKFSEYAKRCFRVEGLLYLDLLFLVFR